MDPVKSPLALPMQEPARTDISARRLQIPYLRGKPHQEVHLNARKSMKSSGALQDQAGALARTVSAFRLS